MKGILFLLLLTFTSTVFCQKDGDLIIDGKSRVISKKGSTDMMYVDNINMSNQSSVVFNNMIVYVNKNVSLGPKCKLKLNNSKIYYKGNSNAVSSRIIKLKEKVKIADINILSKYPNKPFSIICRGKIVLKGTYNQKKNIKLDNDLYDIWMQGEGFLNNILLTNFKL